MPILIALLLALLLPEASPVPDVKLIVELAPEQVGGFTHAMDRQVYALERIHPAANYYRLAVDSRFGTGFLDDLKQRGLLMLWQYDRKVTPRNTPNDPLYDNQWDMMRIGVEDAWNQTTGGVTATGDTIVVAILDTGFKTDHVDLKDNLWVNRGEIPNDGQDNDHNGYTDDYLGVNVRSGNDTHPLDVHGTSVAGIIGAKGNNNKGVTGVNWNVKLMLISGIQNESDIIEGYEYAKAMRNKYRTSNGAQGAFVVVANLSAGIDNGKPADHQLWCNQYESLGSAGILGVCATTNTNSDVDMFGDMPTTCPSEYLIAVTNTGMDDNKLLFAGYGAVNVDLGAPGTTSLTTILGDDYDDFIGTSAATPHVTGAVALLYAAACADVAALAQTEPASLALQIKNLVLENTDPVTSLGPITRSGGRLQVGRAVGALQELCGSTGGELDILEIAPNPVLDYTDIRYVIPNLKPYELNVYDSAGRRVFRVKPEIIVPGEQSFHLEMSQLVPGVYHVAISQGKDVVSASILVQ